jgi:hypothetical protein
MIEYIEKNIWIIIFIISICLIFVLINKYENMENMENTGCNGKTCRVKSDFYTDKNLKSPENKIIHLKCSNLNNVNNNFYLTSLDKNFNNCNACDISDVKNIMPAIVDVNNTLNDNCSKSEMVKCLNSQNIPNCKSHVDDICKKKFKISSKNYEFILEYYKNDDDKKDDDKKDDDKNDDYYLLRFNNKEKNILSLSIVKPEEKDGIKLDIDPKTGVGVGINPKTKETVIIPPKYIVCFKNSEDDISKLYLDEEKLGKDKVMFRLYFQVGEGVKGRRYLGTCIKELQSDNICEDKLCKNKEVCEKYIKYLCLYPDNKNKNVLWFEPEFVGFKKN